MRRLFFALLAVALASGAASANPVRWTLSGLTFSDGGTASGSFVYDANTNTYSAVNVTTTAGTVILTGASLQYVAAAGLPPTTGQVLVAASNAADLTGARAFALFFGTPLSNAGGTASVTGQEASCINAACTGPAPPSRAVTAGSVNGAPLSSDVPALSPLALLATGLLLAAAGFAALKKGVL